jgi:hypothetical protein
LSKKRTDPVSPALADTLELFPAFSGGNSGSSQTPQNTEYRYNKFTLHTNPASLHHLSVATNLDSQDDTTALLSRLSRPFFPPPLLLLLSGLFGTVMAIVAPVKLALIVGKPVAALGAASRAPRHLILVSHDCFGLLVKVYVLFF